MKYFSFLWMTIILFLVVLCVAKFWVNMQQPVSPVIPVIEVPITPIRGLNLPYDVTSQVGERPYGVVCRDERK